DNSRIFLSKSNSGRLSRIRTVITNSGAFIPAINYREFPLYVLKKWIRTIPIATSPENLHYCNNLNREEWEVYYATSE
ncbi:MAG: hypothetical protein ACLPN1_11000, partial [Dissulfurispiraceae bacterium]